MGALALVVVVGSPACGSESTPGPSTSSTNDAGQVGPCANAKLAFKASNVDVPDATTTGSIGTVAVATPDCEIDGEKGTISCAAEGPPKFVFATVTQPAGGQIGVFTACSFRIEQTAMLAVTGKRPIVLVAYDTIDVVGMITTAPNTLGEAVGGGFDPPPLDSKGLGPGGGDPSSSASAPGGAGFCGKGGAGGASSGTPQAGGVAYGTPDLVPLIGGSSGGAGFNGGAGGGAVQLVAGTKVTIAATGVVHAGGAGGNAESGGGSGGAILIESLAVAMSGTLAANGGSGGGGVPDFGVNSTPDAKPASGGGQGTDSPGGNGGAAATVDGGAGVYGMTNARHSGGGGGAGRIRINAGAGGAQIGGTISPGLTTPCATQGATKS